MNVPELAQGLANFLCFILIITVHEFGHAWMASRCGDDTSRMLGRVTLNPAAHIDPVGTIALPLIAVFLAASGAGQLASFVIGWGKPVPVNIGNLRHRVRDDILVTLAGPAMNVVIAMVALIIRRVAITAGWDVVVEASGRMAMLSMFIFFFNLIPVPPLDGSRVMRHIIGMGEEAFMTCPASEWLS
jgi:Zn-dependent protease